VAKYDTAGNLLWIRQGNYYFEETTYGNGIFADVSGNVYFVARDGLDSAAGLYDADGNLIWSDWAAIVDPWPSALAADSQGSFYIAGLGAANGSTVTGWFLMKYFAP
jgi:hypothetical protein